MNFSLKKYLLISCFIFTLFGACVSLKNTTQQPIEQSYRLNVNMSKQEVVAILGQPIKSDFYKNVDEWFYCKTGIGGDQHLALFFHEGKLIAKKNYVVTVSDVDGQTGSCEWFIKRGNYREPDEVVEIRMKYRN